MRKCSGRILLSILAVLSCPSLAYAYVDPVAGSMLLQLLLGGLAGLFTFVRIFRHRLSKLFGFRKDDGKK